MHATIISPYFLQSQMLANSLKRANIEILNCSPENFFSGWQPNTDTVIFYHPLKLETWKKLYPFFSNINKKIPIILIGKAHQTILKEKFFKDFTKQTLLIDDTIKFDQIADLIKNCIDETKYKVAARYIQFEEILLDRKNREMICGKENFLLTKKEFHLIELLMTNKGRVTSRETIIDYVWDRRKFISQNTIEVYICKLRKKLDQNKKGFLISTIPCLGYQFGKMETLQNNYMC